MKKTITEVFEFVEQFLGRELTARDKAAITKLVAELVADLVAESVPPPTAPPPPKP